MAAKLTPRQKFISVIVLILVLFVVGLIGAGNLKESIKGQEPTTGKVVNDVPKEPSEDIEMVEPETPYQGNIKLTTNIQIEGYQITLEDVDMRLLADSL